MRPRLIATGTLGLALALVWTTYFVFQRANLAFLMNVVSAADAPAAIRVTSLWSLMQIWMPTLLALPMAVMSIAAMLGVTRMLRLLRRVAVFGAVLSAGVLLLFAASAVPKLAAGDSLLLANTRIYAELLVALVSLGLQMMVVALCRRIDTDSSDTSVTKLVSDVRHKTGASQPTSRRDPQLTALPAHRFAAR